METVLTARTETVTDTRDRQAPVPTQVRHLGLGPRAATSDLGMSAMPAAGEAAGAAAGLAATMTMTVATIAGHATTTTTRSGQLHVDDTKI